jgi:CheY-like chemotaxis protein
MEPTARLTGEISATNFPTILLRAATRAPRGVLLVGTGDAERKIQLREGRILFAGSSEPTEFLAERARRAGLVTHDQIRQALVQSTTGRRIGSALVRLGFLSEEKLVELLLDQIRNIVSSCFAATKGQYLLQVGELPTHETIVLDEPVPMTICRELRRITVIERLRAAAGSPSDRCFPVKGWRERFEARDLARDGALADLVELVADSPGISIRNIVVSLPMPEVSILQSLWILRSLEVLGTRSVEADAQPPAPAGETPEERENVARSFLESLAASPPPAVPAPKPEPPKIDLPAEEPPAIEPETFAALIAEEDLPSEEELALDAIFGEGAGEETVWPVDDPSSNLERALSAAEEEVDVVLALGMEKAAATGSFEETPFAHILRDLCRQRSTGTLICKRGDEEKTVTLDRGRPIFATTNVPGERLTERLVSEGLLVPSDLVRLSEFWPSARRVGGILLALRLVDPDALRKAIRRQVAEITSSLYAWNEGGGYFLERPEPTSEEVISDLSLPEIALRGAQKIGDPARLAALLGGEARRYRVTEDPASLLQGIALPDDQREFIARLGVGGTVEELALLGPVPARSALFLLAMLASSGLIEPTGLERITASGIPDPGRILGSRLADQIHMEGPEAASRDLTNRWNEIAGQGDYSVLGIDAGAPAAEVISSFEAQAPQWHPDRFRSYADAAILRLAGRVFDRHVLAFYRILNPPQKTESEEEAAVRKAMLGPSEAEIAAGIEQLGESTGIRTRVLPPTPSTSALPLFATALVLDDDPKSAALLSGILVELGFAPEVAPGRVALRRVLSTPDRKIRLALLDVELLRGLDASNLDALEESFAEGGTILLGLTSDESQVADAPLLGRFAVRRFVDRNGSEAELREILAPFGPSGD